VECLFQFESPPAGVGVILSDNFHLSRRQNRSSGLTRSFTIDTHPSGQNQGPRLLSGFGESAFHLQHIEPTTLGHAYFRFSFNRMTFFLTRLVSC
jgi:hypothetical protein